MAESESNKPAIRLTSVMILTEKRPEKAEIRKNLQSMTCRTVRREYITVQQSALRCSGQARKWNIYYF